MARAPKGSKSGAAALKSAAGETSPFDLQRALDYWVAGEWGMLAVKDAELIAPDRDRGLTAAYVASAHQFCDSHDGARLWARRALEWGCPAPYLARVLIAGAHITMARMAAAAGDAERARAHMAKSAEPVAGEKSQVNAEARLSKELAGLGMLEAAAKSISDDLNKLAEQPLGSASRHRCASPKSRCPSARRWRCR